MACSDLGHFLLNLNKEKKGEIGFAWVTVGSITSRFPFTIYNSPYLLQHKPGRPLPERGKIVAELQ